MPHYKLESAHAPRRVCGVDEAGRGPLAGPVVAASVMFLNRRAIPKGLNDSKKLSVAARVELAQALFARPEQIIIGVGIGSVEEIDTYNIWGATSLAMCRAFDNMPERAELALVDGKLKPKHFTYEAHPVIGGDAISLSIAAASIIAKTTRDRMMQEYAQAHPHYGFETHAGYGTPAHLRALETHGPCPIHRRSFKRVKAA